MRCQLVAALALLGTVLGCASAPACYDEPWSPCAIEDSVDEGEDDGKPDAR